MTCAYRTYAKIVHFNHDHCFVACFLKITISILFRCKKKTKKCPSLSGNSWSIMSIFYAYRTHRRPYLIRKKKNKYYADIFFKFFLLFASFWLGIYRIVRLKTNDNAITNVYAKNYEVFQKRKR